MENSKPIYKKITNILNLINWILLVFAAGFLDRARPPFETFLNRLEELPVRKTWKMDLLDYAMYLFILMIILSISAFIINIIARRKEKFKITYTPFFIVIVSIYAIVWYLIKFH